MKNLEAKPEFKEKIKELFTKLVALQKDMDDVLNLTEIFLEV